MSYRSSRYWYHEPGALWIFLLSALIARPTSAVVATTLDVDTFKYAIDDASGPGDFHTAPHTSSPAPPGSASDISGWTNQLCIGCPNKPDLTRLYNQTYTAIYLPAGNSFSYNISFQFSGRSIEVYLVLSNHTPTTCDFILDGNTTTYTQSTAYAYQYDTLAFSNHELDLRTHELTIKAEGKPDTANYLNFDYANFARPNIATIAGILNQTDFTLTSTPTPSPSATPTDNHLTVKAIAGGVVGGFIAILALILLASFYRHRRLRHLEEAAHPFLGSISGSTTSHKPVDEHHHLIPLSLSQTNHQQQNSQTFPNPHTSGVTPFDLHSTSLPPPNVHFNNPNSNSEQRDQIRQERQRELNNRLETVTSQMRSLKSSYIQDQRRLHNQTQQRAQEFGQGYAGRHLDPDPPVIRLVAGGMPHPLAGQNRGGAGEQPAMQPAGEPMVDPSVLVDMRDQMRIMMDQIQYLRAQQNSPYAQGLTDEPPPGYGQVINAQYNRYQ